MAEKKPLNKKISIPAVLVVIAVAFFLVKGIMQQPQINDNKEKIDDLTAQIAEQEQKLETLEELKDKVDTDEYIEKVAREKLGLIKENEIIFIDVARE